jgi:N utilization substance protein B
MNGALTRQERLHRSRARAWALQVLYRWESEETERDLRDVLVEVARTRLISPHRITFVRRILEALQEHRAEVDRVLTRVTTNWRLERLSRIDRSILRLGAAELLFVDETPPKVAIQESVRLAGRYGGPESPRFVNGVLDAIYKQKGKEVG